MRNAAKSAAFPEQRNDCSRGGLVLLLVRRRLVYNAVRKSQAVADSSPTISQGQLPWRSGGTPHRGRTGTNPFPPLCLTQDIGGGGGGDPSKPCEGRSSKAPEAELGAATSCSGESLARSLDTLVPAPCELRSAWVSACKSCEFLQARRSLFARRSFVARRSLNTPTGMQPSWMMPGGANEP